MCDKCDKRLQIILVLSDQHFMQIPSYRHGYYTREFNMHSSGRPTRCICTSWMAPKGQISNLSRENPATLDESFKCYGDKQRRFTICLNSQLTFRTGVQKILAKLS